MTPDDYFERIGSLIETGRFEEALALAEAHGRDVTPNLRPEQFFELSNLLELAQRAVDYPEALQSVSSGGKSRRPASLPARQSATRT